MKQIENSTNHLPTFPLRKCFLWAFTTWIREIRNLPSVIFCLFVCYWYLFSCTCLRHMRHLYHDKYLSLGSISKTAQLLPISFFFSFCCLLLWHSICIAFTKALWRQLQTFFPSSFKFSFFFISACYRKGTSRLLESWDLWLTPSYRGGSEEDCEPLALTSWQWYKGF